MRPAPSVPSCDPDLTAISVASICGMTAIRKEDDELVPLCFKESPSEVAPVAHNGYKFDFPFLLSECQRNEFDWGEFSKSWRFVDTLDLVRAIDLEVFGGCQKLQ